MEKADERPMGPANQQENPVPPENEEPKIKSQVYFEEKAENDNQEDEEVGKHREQEREAENKTEPIEKSSELCSSFAPLKRGENNTTKISTANNGSRSTENPLGKTINLENKSKKAQDKITGKERNSRDRKREHSRFFKHPRSVKSIVIGTEEDVSVQSGSNSTEPDVDEVQVIKTVIRSVLTPKYAEPGRSIFWRCRRSPVPIVDLTANSSEED